MLADALCTSFQTAVSHFKVQINAIFEDDIRLHFGSFVPVWAVPKQ